MRENISIVIGTWRVTGLKENTRIEKMRETRSLFIGQEASFSVDL
jgi:hypothetical protein